MAASLSYYGLPPALRSVVESFQQRRTKTTADRSLARRLHDAVRTAKLGVRGLAFYVHDGAVSIYGSLSDEATREALLCIVTRQPGVRRVVDHVRVEPPLETVPSGPPAQPPAAASPAPVPARTTSPRPAVASTNASASGPAWDWRTASAISAPPGE